MHKHAALLPEQVSGWFASRAADSRPDQLLCGAIAAAAATGTTLALAVALNLPSLPELVADAVTRATPLVIIERMISTFGSSAKAMLFGGVLAAQVVIGAMVGAAAERRRWSVTEEASTVMLALSIVGLGLLPAVGAGLLGTLTAAGAPRTTAGLMWTGIVFLIVHRYLLRILNPGGFFAAEEAASRRAFLRRSVLGACGLAGAWLGWRGLASWMTPPEVSATLSSEVRRSVERITAAPSLADALREPIPGLSPEITPNERFYVVSKNAFRDPTVDERGWLLDLVGLVDHPLTLTYADLKALPSAEQYLTLQCISNEVGGELIGNARWRGVPLRDLLHQAGVRSEAVDVVFHAADDYTDSIPLAKARQSDTMLVYEMNGATLPPSHGFPARLLVPDIYGMKNVKWVTKIELVGYDFVGYWQRQGWSDVATMHTTSRIDLPRNQSYLRGGRSFVGGVAVAGQRGISSVEVSTDDGRSWQPAVIKPALGPNSWVLWLFEWDLPLDAADRRLLVRAVDGTRAAQVATRRETVPNGATGYHQVGVRLAEN